ncbi:NAD(P)/FAD-dependent oxidoreductase [Planotetraspora kaengkrachanensis]|uniref:NADH dehydrogenase n=1 Tax=Planotetraspora kaengkrachanensis TaxID=575193 RepID=A0A8J3M0Q3_9ACTN|nr:FAD-dependent oxidoreductase [Planotetraspora kaengkrachanensis]GIG76926.1 NADH dehydrogenase [Planotetraspora kaengkrachanensis]
MTDNPGGRPNVVIVGGGYGGINAAKGLDDVADVTLVDASEIFVHNVAAWRALVEPVWLEKIFMPYDRLLKHGRFLRDRAVAVEGRRVTLESGKELEPDYLVLATGSTYPFPAKTDAPDAETARARHEAAHDELLRATRVLLVGAGPTGLELAGEIKAFFPDKQVTIVDVGADVLPGPFDQSLRDDLRRQLDEIGVELKLGSPLRDLPDTAPATFGEVTVVTETGEKLTADIWFRCFGLTPQSGYLKGSLATTRDANGYLRVDEHLQVIGHDRVYALGDITDADRNTAGGATYQGQLLAANLRTLITGEGELGTWQPLPPIIVVPLGPEKGAAWLPGEDGVGALAGPEVTSAVKGSAMLVDNYSAMFDGPGTRS